MEDITTPADPTLRVEDRKTTNVIATINNNDKDENLAMAQAVVDTINNYGEVNDSD